MFMSRADGISTGSMPPSDESGDARLPVTPNENSTDLYNLSTAARISRTPSLGSDAIDLKSFGSTWSESEQSYMDMPEDSSFSNMTTSISGVERDSMKNPGLFDRTSHSESRTELKLDDSLNSSSVDCVLDSVRNVSAEIKTVLPVAESEIAELSVHRESALCRKSLELPEVMKTVHATEDRVYDSSINPAETAFSVEAEKNGKKVPKKVHFKISESSVIAPSAPPKQKKGFGRNKATTGGNEKHKYGKIGNSWRQQSNL
ncbi:hypothetical protein TTRE_0000765501 [Trichuris trichiura]|uniref:Uncharacterized protein n=1 Tax=Trichuris trichiura TaxID=36087 RepID=A0A077ZIB1_TRITR|nr:hypothetical protein TTRE_0000765501 [Trichuris trichiura]